MVPGGGKIGVQQGDEFGAAFPFFLAQGLRHDGEGVGNAVQGVVIGQFGDGKHGGHGSVSVPAVHRVGPGREGFPGAAAVRRIARLLAVNHVGGNGQDGLGGEGAAVGVELAQLFHEPGDQAAGNLVHARVIVTVAREFPFRPEIHNEAVFIADGLHRGVLDGGQGVRGHGEPGDARSHRTQDFRIMQRHFNAFIAVLVVHVVNDVQGVNVGLGKPVLHLVVQGHHFIILQNFLRIARGGRGYLLALEFIHAAVQGIEQALGEVGARAEELHLLADAHGGYAACNAVVVTPVRAHQVVVFILDGRRLNGDPGAEALKGFRQVPGP